MKVTANKHNPARSGIDQPCDVTETFKLLKSMQKMYTVKNTPPDQHPMKLFAHKMFESLSKDGKLVLKPTKKHALLDFISVVPEMVTIAAKRSYILKGFTTPGMIDSTFHRYPDYNTLLATCRRNPSKAEYQLCYSSFTPLFEKFHATGLIDDDYLEELGFPIDLDAYGNRSRRTATIAQEYLQRCKCLTHSTQKKLREERMAAIDEAANEKRMQVDKATAKVLEASNRAVAKICNITNLETDRRSLDAATLQDFAKVLLEDLKSFIMT